MTSPTTMATVRATRDVLVERSAGRTGSADSSSGFQHEMERAATEAARVARRSERHEEPDATDDRASSTESRVGSRLPRALNATVPQEIERTGRYDVTDARGVMTASRSIDDEPATDRARNARPDGSAEGATVAAQNTAVDSDGAVDADDSDDEASVEALTGPSTTPDPTSVTPAPGAGQAAPAAVSAEGAANPAAAAALVPSVVVTGRADQTDQVLQASVGAALTADPTLSVRGDLTTEAVAAQPDTLNAGASSQLSVDGATPAATTGAALVDGSSIATSSDSTSSDSTTSGSPGDRAQRPSAGSATTAVSSSSAAAPVPGAAGSVGTAGAVPSRAAVDAGEPASTTTAGPATNPVPPSAPAQAPAVLTTPVSVGLPSAATVSGASVPASALSQLVLSQVGSRVAAAALMATSQGVHQIVVQLRPAQLGSVKIVATLGEHGLSLQLHAHSEATREILRAALADLRGDLAASGVTDLSSLEVSDRRPDDGSSASEWSGPGEGRGAEQRPTPSAPPARPVPASDAAQLHRSPPGDRRLDVRV